MKHRLLWLSLCGLTLLRLIQVGRLDLSPDEAYYLLWSKHLALAYYSKGPGIALLLRAATAVFGESETGVRVLAPLFALATTALVFLLVRRLFGDVTAVATALVLQALPIFNVGSLVMTIDPPFMAAWMATLLLAWEAMRRERAAEPSGKLPALREVPHGSFSAPTCWAAAGAACGAGILCKYTAILALLGIAVAVLLSPERRRHGRGLALATAIALLAMTPTLVWNSRHGWPTVTHLAERGALGKGSWLQPRETLEFLVVHIATWSPLVFVAILMALPAAIRRARTNAATRFLLAASAPVLVMYMVLALHEAGEANWTAPGILGLLPIAVEHWRSRVVVSRAARAFAVSAVALGVILSLAIVDTDLLRSGGIPLRAKRDPTTRLRGWSTTANDVAKLRRSVEHEQRAPVLLVANHYGVASELAYYLPRAPAVAPEHPSVYVVPTPRPKNEFFFWPGLAEAATLRPGSAALFVSDRPQPPPESLEDAFAGGCEALEPIPIERGGDVLRTIHPWLCRDLVQR